MRCQPGASTRSPSETPFSCAMTVCVSPCAGRNGSMSISIVAADRQARGRRT
jgi:hypothetical protein